MRKGKKSVSMVYTFLRGCFLCRKNISEIYDGKKGATSANHEARLSLVKGKKSCQRGQWRGAEWQMKITGFFSSDASQT